ncbi:MAG: 16S rRNA (uracil(1498)-N(3))-methyltransferase [Rickettsiales bacterium]|jgi:16S rRNA (uracil1498-N3)-methyltransferase|nr:16S rRNA (uracil(1498)-N(3))-methyltransferase [Rickettsiales bacterium]
MIRIFIDTELQAGESIRLDATQIHYLRDVMRLKDGDQFLTFGGGAEFIAEFRGANAAIKSRTERSDSANGAVLAFCPIKPARLEEMISMATQMGVAAFQPVISKRVDIPKMNFQRFRKIAIEAAEQCGRLSVPEIREAVKFNEFVKTTGKVYFADERTAATTPALRATPSPLRGTFVLLIGAEGGFTANEFDALDASGAIGINLGKTILRAETAAVAGLAMLLNK